MKTYTLIGVFFVALGLAGCQTTSSSCYTAKALYEKSLEEGWGGQAEVDAAKKVYGVWVKKCAAVGINL